MRKKVGQGLWLYALLIRCIPQWDEKSCVFVPQAFTDCQLAQYLDAKIGTIAAWRRRLKTAGLLDWMIKPGLGRVFILQPIAGREFFQAAGEGKPQEPAASKLQETLAAPQPAPRKPNEHLASRLVQ